MSSYVFQTPPSWQTRPVIVLRNDDAHIPMHDDNTDCTQFVLDWKEGAEVKNPDGTDAPYSDAAVKALGLTPP